MLKQLFIRKEKPQTQATLIGTLALIVMISEGYIIRKRFPAPGALKGINDRVRVNVPCSFGRRFERRIANGARETVGEWWIVLFLVANKFGLGSEIHQAVRVVAHERINHGWRAV